MFFKYVLKMARFLGCSIILGTLGLLGLKSYEYLSETFVVVNETLWSDLKKMKLNFLGQKGN